MPLPRRCLALASHSARVSAHVSTACTATAASGAPAPVESTFCAPVTHHAASQPPAASASHAANAPAVAATATASRAAAVAAAAAAATARTARDSAGQGPRSGAPW